MTKSDWQPSKAEFWRGAWRASRDCREVSAGSRLVADLSVAAYARLLREHARGVLADIGCGKAPYYGIYSPLVSQAIWVDWTNSLHLNPQLDVTCDLNEGIALPGESVDTVLCTDVLEHIFNAGKLWREIARILKPGGKVIVGVPFLYWIHEAPHDYHRYTSFALQRYAEEAGLDMRSVETLGGWSYVWADLICKRLHRPKLQAAFAAAVRPFLSESGCRPLDDCFPLHYILMAGKSKNVRQTGRAEGSDLK